jgi:hypothetical protein
VNAAESDWGSEPEEAWEEDDKWNPEVELPADFVVANFSLKTWTLHPHFFIRRLITLSAQ